MKASFISAMEAVMEDGADQNNTLHPKTSKG